MIFKGKEWGVADGEPVLGLHGWLDNCATFDRLAPLLPLHKLRFIALDLPGHGHSSHFPPGLWYRWPDYVLCVARVVQHLKWKQFSFLSHSMGANVSFIYAGCFPENVKRLVSLDIFMLTMGVPKLFLNPPKELDSKNWDVANIYRDWMMYMLAYEKSNSGTKLSKYSKTMDELLNKTVLDVNNRITHDSARILLKRGAKLVGVDPELYMLCRDRRLYIFDFLMNERQIEFFCKKITADLLIFLANFEGILSDCGHSEFKRFSQFMNVRSFRLEYFDGNHYGHLNTPEKLAKTVADFLLNQKSR